MKGMLVLAATTLLVPAVALAGSPEPAPIEPVIAAPPPAPVSDWTGPYAGVQLGYGFGEFNLDPRDVDELDTDGVIGGVHLGYLQDLGQWVIGGELQYDAADLSISNDSGASGSFDNLARLKVRAGRDLGQTLVYGTLGVAYANFSGFDGLTDVDIDEPGYVAGLGVDYKLTENWLLGGEYMFHRFNDFGPTGDDVNLNTIHVRASYQF